MSDLGRTNGFRIRTLNPDCDRLAVQSSVQTTWFCTYKARWWGKFGAWSRDVGITQNELIVLRPYQGKPVIELEGLGGPHGVLIVDKASGGTRVLRNGQREKFELECALVIKTENIRYPRSDGGTQAGV